MENNDDDDNNNNEPIKSKIGRDTFIFGSWKCRNPNKSRVASKDIVVVVAKTSDGEKDFQRQHRNSSSSSTYDSYTSTTTNTTEERKRNANDPTSRRAISTYDRQLNDNDFWCPRCNEKMEEPRLLACLHSVCSRCVDEFMSKDYYDNNNAKTIRPINANNNRKTEGCPICDYPLPRHGTSSSPPPPHYTLQHRLVVDAVRRRLSQRLTICDTCNNDTNDEVRISRVAVCLDHPEHPLRYHCVACSRPTCKQCVWTSHRGHANEEANDAGKRATFRLNEALSGARRLLNTLLDGYRRNDDDDDDEPIGTRARTALDVARDSLPRVWHSRSRSSVSSHSREARERIREYTRLKRARQLIDAIYVGDDLLVNGNDVEILGLERVITKRLRYLGVSFNEFHDNCDKKRNNATLTFHSGNYHCCTFCSSGGKKEAICGCNGTMPGGYKGCGHGHSGHPGVRHWSCCGSIERDSICLLPRKRTFKITL